MTKKRRKRRRDKGKQKPRMAARLSPAEEKLREEERAPTEVGAVSWVEEYPYVYQDLKSIAILAGSMFAIIIILSFVIR